MSLSVLSLNFQQPYTIKNTLSFWHTQQAFVITKVHKYTPICLSINELLTRAYLLIRIALGKTIKMVGSKATRTHT